MYNIINTQVANKLTNSNNNTVTCSIKVHKMLSLMCRGVGSGPRAPRSGGLP